MSRACFRPTRPDMTLTPADLCAPFDWRKALRPSGCVACPVCGEPTKNALCGGRECVVAYRLQVRAAERLAVALARAAAEGAESGVSA